MLWACRQGHHAGTTAQCSFGTEQRSAASAEIAADDQHLTKASFMISWRAGCEGRQVRLAQAQGGRLDLVDDLRIGLQVIEYQRSDSIRTLASKQTEFEADKGHSQLGPHNLPEQMPRVGTQPRRQVDRKDRQRAVVHCANDARVGFANLSGDPST